MPSPRYRSFLQGPFTGKPDFLQRIFANTEIIKLSLFNIVPCYFNALMPALEKRVESEGKNSLGRVRSHSCTADRNSLSRNCFPLSAFFNGPKTLKSDGERSGEYGGCGMHSNRSSSMVDTVAVAVCGLAFSWRRHTPIVNSPRSFWRIDGFRVSLRRFK